MIDNIDLDILKFMSERDNYDGYKDVIHKGLCTRESWTLVGDFGRYFEEYPAIKEIDDDFTLWFRVQGHPGWKPDEHKIYTTIIRNIKERDAPDRHAFATQMEHLSFESELTSQKEALSSGNTSPSDVLDALGHHKATNSNMETPEAAFSLDDLAKNKRSNTTNKKKYCLSRPGT